MADSIAFDRIADRYDETRGGVERGRKAADVLAPHLPSDETVLEIGVGTGAVALPLREQHGRRVVGIDLSIPMLRRAQERVGPRVAQGDALQLPVPDASVGGVVASWVLHLVGDRVGALHEVARVLRPGGRLVAVDAQPNMDHDELEPYFRRIGALKKRLPTEELVAGCEALVLDEVVLTPTDPYEQSPNQFAEQLEDRVFASLWNLDDERWENEVVPVIRDLRALPDPDRPRTRRARHPIAILTRT